MKRLTGYNSFGGVYAIGMGCKNKTDTIHTALCCLAAYEDTGLTPEICAHYKKFEDEAISKGVTFGRIVELMNADADGRLVVLPCKVGDEVWGIKNYRGTWHPQRGRVSEMYYTNDMRLHIVVKNICRGVWGEKVFATYPEADKATHGGYGNGR